MSVKKSERLIVKFITNQASQEEIEILTQWLEDNGNQKVFKDFVRTNYTIDTVMHTFDSTEIKNRIIERIQQENNIFYKRRIQSYFKYVAVIVLFLGLTYFYQESSFKQKDNVLTPKEVLITLQMADGSIQIVNTLSSKNITDKLGKVIGKQDKNKIKYSNEISSEKLAYNTLNIPYGKRFELELSDGTIVHMNSGTSLKYPVRFLKNKNRQVFLTGEAFFEVAKDKANSFTVNTQEMNVEVLGTKFNVSTYKEDRTSDVVLVEGKVSLFKDKKTTENQVYLTPGLKGSSTRGQQKITTEIVNTDYYTAWVKGKLVFKNIPFDAIVKKLERHYNVTFINKNKTLGKEVFNASFSEEPIEVVLKYFSDSYAIDYTIKDNKIIIQ